MTTEFIRPARQLHRIAFLGVTVPHEIIKSSWPSPFCAFLVVWLFANDVPDAVTRAREIILSMGYEIISPHVIVGPATSAPKDELEAGNRRAARETGLSMAVLLSPKDAPNPEGENVIDLNTYRFLS